MFKYTECLLFRGCVHSLYDTVSQAVLLFVQWSEHLCITQYWWKKWAVPYKTYGFYSDRSLCLCIQNAYYLGGVYTLCMILYPRLYCCLYSGPNSPVSLSTDEKSVLFHKEPVDFVVIGHYD